VGTDEWHFLIFFDRPFPADIGYRASASDYSRQVLATAFNTHIDDLANFPFKPADPIVKRRNPVDELVAAAVTPLGLGRGSAWRLLGPLVRVFHDGAPGLGVDLRLGRPQPQRVDHPDDEHCQNDVGPGLEHQ
jgi:hypothetical protein